MDERTEELLAMVRQLGANGDSDECWPWLGSISRGGYGNSTRAYGGSRWAHRVVYALLVGPIPPGMTLDHLCHTADPSCPGGSTCLHRRCVNPSHLEAVPHKVNNARSSYSLSAQNTLKTHCKWGHPFSGENLYIAPAGDRRCRICSRESKRRRRARLVEARQPSEGRASLWA